MIEQEFKIEKQIREKISKVEKKLFIGECCSRLLHKNVVFKGNFDNVECCLKVYYNGDNKLRRMNNEIKLYDYFKDFKTIKVPNILKKGYVDGLGYLIIEWIKGDSLKRIVKKTPEVRYHANLVLGELGKIWKINDSEIIRFFSAENIGVLDRINLNIKEDELFRLINEKSSYLFNDIIAIYRDIREKYSSPYNCLINSDVSAHEFIFNDEGIYMIDFENFKIGNPNNDLASLFYSICSSLYEKNYMVSTIYDLFKKNTFFLKHDFLYFLIEKFLANAFVSFSIENLNEYDYFIKFIKNINYEINGGNKVNEYCNRYR